MPAFLKHFKEERHVNAPKAHPILGTLLNSIRTGLNLAYCIQHFDPT